MPSRYIYLIYAYFPKGYRLAQGLSPRRWIYPGMCIWDCIQNNLGFLARTYRVSSSSSFWQQDQVSAQCQRKRMLYRWIPWFWFLNDILVLLLERWFFQGSASMSYHSSSFCLYSLIKTPNPSINPPSPLQVSHSLQY